MAKNPFKPKKKTERDYYNALITVCSQIGQIIARFFDSNEPKTLDKVSTSLKKYEKTLDPWARRIAKQVIEEVNQDNLQSWADVSKRMSEVLSKGYKSQDKAFKTALKLQNEQVTLIKTLPSKAAERIQRLSREYYLRGIRQEVLAKKVMDTQGLVKYRAACIARTEISKAQTALTTARAESVGISHYYWRTVEDGIVRDLHKHLNGKKFAFDKPPLVGREGRHGPGDYPNCRCYAEPIIEEANIDGANDGDQDGEQ